MSCPNNYGNALNGFFSSGILSKDSPTLSLDRQRLFLYGCIPFRSLLILLLLLSFIFINEKRYLYHSVLKYIVLFISIISLIAQLSKQITKEYKCQWWNYEFEVFIRILLIYLSLICIFNNTRIDLILFFVLLFHLIIGLIQYFIKQPFSV